MGVGGAGLRDGWTEGARGGGVGASKAWETVVRLAAQGRRKGSGRHCVSRTTRFAACESMVVVGGADRRRLRISRSIWMVGRYGVEVSWHFRRFAGF